MGLTAFSQLLPIAAIISFMLVVLSIASSLHLVKAGIFASLHLVKQLFITQRDSAFGPVKTAFYYPPSTD